MPALDTSDLWVLTSKMHAGAVPKKKKINVEEPVTTVLAIVFTVEQGTG